MNKAHATEMRKCLDAAQAFKEAGLLFIPIPVLNKDDYNMLISQMHKRIEQIESAINKGTE